MDQSPTPTSTDAAIAEIRRIYSGQSIHSIKLGFGRRAGVLVVDFQHLYTRGRASTGLAAVEATARLLAAAVVPERRCGEVDGHRHRGHREARPG